MERPLRRHSIVELEQLLSSAIGDTNVLHVLDEEFKHRNVPRAVALSEKVRRALGVAKPSAKTPATPEPADKQAPGRPAQQGALWGEEQALPPETTGAPVGAQVAKPAVVPLSAVPPVTSPENVAPASEPAEAVPAMRIDEAYRVLKATPGTTWEAIEQTRRHLVQEAHPENVAELSLERRAQVQAAANRVNTAYAVIFKARTNSG
jgi:hypothetical protein